jgi:two-component system phosphate regulon sensor histidine kinase PhoR
MKSGLVAGAADQYRGFRHIVTSLVVLVLVPTVFLLAIGILMVVFWDEKLNVLFGILVMTLVGCLVAGGVLVLVLIRREAHLSKLQLDFVSKVSHELRTPLTSIRMFVEMLQETHDDEERKVCLDVLHKETGRLTDRIERLLDWGRMEAGRRVYDRQPETVEVIIREALEAFDASRVGRQQDIEVDIAPELPSLEADRGALGDAIVNLLSNAVKYSGDDKHIAVRVTRDGRCIRIAVSDNGRGIPRREHKHVFERFYRVDDRLSRDVEGSGLGLAIVRHVAIAHGGHVELDSLPGRGSTFSIVLPSLATTGGQKDDTKDV